jgi:uncharacterized phage-associated protein
MTAMATVFDVSAFINELIGPLRARTYRLQKLVYYCQAWSMAWDNRPLFGEEIQAWTEGPACHVLWKDDDARQGDATRLSDAERATVTAVVDLYNRFTNSQLIALTHREAPWRNARRGYKPHERSSTEITTGAMAQYYGALADTGGDKKISDAVRRGIWLLLNTPDDEVDKLNEPDLVDGDDVLHWLETGENDPWARKAEFSS